MAKKRRGLDPVAEAMRRAGQEWGPGKLSQSLGPIKTAAQLRRVAESLLAAVHPDSRMAAAARFALQSPDAVLARPATQEELVDMAARYVPNPRKRRGENPRGRHPRAYAVAGGRAVAAAMRRAQLPSLLEAVRRAKLEPPVSGPEYERVILALHAAGIEHNMTDEPYTQRIIAGKGDYVKNPRKRPRRRSKYSPRARRYVARTVRALAHKGERAPRRVAIALSKARARGLKVPPRRNPAQPDEGPGQNIRNAIQIARNARHELDRVSHLGEAEIAELFAAFGDIIQRLTAALVQVEAGRRGNPALAVFGLNPGRRGKVGSDHVQAILYRHKEDGRNYVHAFGKGIRVQNKRDGSTVVRASRGAASGVRAVGMPDGSVVLRHPAKPIWRDFPNRE